jgi:hypothetical protein
MVTIGIDAHKRSHTVVAVDEQGRRLAAKTVGTTSADHLELVAWAARFGERIVRVPPKLMANARTAARSFGKSDPIDALAAARAALREPDLPVAKLDGPSAKCGSSSITAKTWWASEPASSAVFAGTCTSSTLATNQRCGRSTISATSTCSPSVWRASKGRWHGSPVSSSIAAVG